MKSHIEKLLPHRGRMLLLNNVLEVTNKFAETEVEIESDSLFCIRESVPAWVGIEYLAQTVAVFGGKNAAGETAKIGFLLGVRKYRSEIPFFKVGSKLKIRIENQIEHENVGTFSGSIFLDGKIIAEGQLTTLTGESK